MLLKQKQDIEHRFDLKNLPFWLLFILMACVCAMRISLINASFPTVDDEAYWLFKLKEAYSGILAGESQWNLIAIKWFPYWDLTSKFHSDLACHVLMLTAALISAFGCAYALERKSFIKYLSVMMLFLVPVEGRLSYLTFLVFFVCVSTTAFLVYGFAQNRVVRIIMLVIASLSATLAIFAVPSGGALVLALLAVSVVVMNWNGGARQVFSHLGWGFVGFIIAIAYMHFFVYNVGDIVRAMVSFTVDNITSNPYQHNAAAIILSVVLFFKDLLFVVLIYTGAYAISRKLHGYKWQFGAALLYLAIIFVVFHYQKKPVIYSTHLFTSLFVLPLLFGENELSSWKSLLSKENILKLCFVFMPIAAAFGSNSFSARVGCFAFSWTLIWFMQKDKTIDWYVPATAMLLLLLPLVINTTKQVVNRDDSYHFTQGNQYFAKVSLLPEQKEYFDRVYGLVMDYGYKPDSSVVFATEYDYTTIYALDAKVSSDFYQPLNFLYWDVSQMLKPDFVIMFGLDEQTIGERLREAGWGWPEEFDAFPIGTPETWYVYDEELDQRILYCRKSLRLKP